MAKVINTKIDDGILIFTFTNNKDEVFSSFKLNPTDRCLLISYLIRSQKQSRRKSKRGKRKCKQQSISIRRSIQNDRL